MKFYIDTANVAEIREAYDMGIIAGVTTNPSLIAKEGRDYQETLKEIASFMDGPISGEVRADSDTAEKMIAEGREIAALSKNMVVKIPMTAEGLKAVKVLSKEGIKTNVTLIFYGRFQPVSGLGNRSDLCFCKTPDSCFGMCKDRGGHCDRSLQGFAANDFPSSDRSGN